MKLLNIVLVMASLSFSSFAQAQSKDVRVLLARVLGATATVENLAGDHADIDARVPRLIMRNAVCVTVIPAYKSAAFVIGGSYGNGLASCRNEQGEFDSIYYVKLWSGSFGYQIGSKTADMMFVDSNRNAAQNFLNNSEKFKLGGEAGFSAGPVGRAAYAGTNVTLKEETLAYSTAGRGIFGGLDMKATFLGRDFKAAYLASDPQVKLALDSFKALLNQLTTEVPPPAPVAKPIPMIAPLKPRSGVAPENVQTGEPVIQNDPS